jgi:iron complex outermembrane recepter protein
VTRPSVKSTPGVLLLAVLGCSVTATAQAPQSSAPTPLRELSLEQLGRLEVTSVAKQPAEVWRTPAAITVLTQDDIRRSGATTLAELLRLVGGVQVSRIDSNRWAVGIRGLTSAFSKALLVLIDGRSVYTPIFGGVYWQVQETLLEDIDRIEVIRGPGGTIWGSNAVNGVINVITRHSRDSTGTLVSAGGGNVNQGRVSMRYGAERASGLSYRVYATGTRRDVAFHRDGRLYDDWSLAQTGFRLDFGGPGRQSLRLQGDAYRGTMGNKVAVGSFNPPAQLLIEGDDIVRGGNLVAAWERELPASTSLRVQAYYDRTIRHAINFEEDRNTVDVDALLRTPIGQRHQVAWGAGARSSRSDFTAVFPTLTVSPEDRDQRLASLYAQDEIAVASDQLFATLGAKLEHNTYSGWEVQPNARLLWRVDTQETLWVSVTRAVRTPSRVETDLRLTGFARAVPPVYFQLSGSATFDAEDLVGLEAGYRRLVSPSLYVDVTAFHNKYDGLASFSPLTQSLQPAPFPHLLVSASYENGIDATGDGFEISPDWRPLSWARLRGSYALLTIDAEGRPGSTDAGNVNLYEGSVPRHQGFVQASLTLPKGIEVDYTHRAVSQLMSRDVVRHVPRYVTADARIARTANGLTLALAAHNLFAPRHVEFFTTEFPTPGVRRSVFVSATWRQ